MTLTKRIEAVKARAKARAAAAAPTAIVNVKYHAFNHNGASVAAIGYLTAERISTNAVDSRLTLV